MGTKEKVLSSEAGSSNFRFSLRINAAYSEVDADLLNNTYALVSLMSSHIHKS